MLVDVRLGRQVLPSEIYAMMGIAPQRIGRGLYVNCGFNFHNAIADQSFDDLYNFDDEDESEADIGVPSYGVADSVEQFIEKFGKKLEESPNEYCVGFTEVKRADQPKEGGWRWHKWGEYIGTKEPQYEYLHDEPEIESVVTFSVMRRRK